MNAKVKRLWLKALRSGKFKQVKGWLRKPTNGGDTYSYCCLGVLCEVYHQHQGRGSWRDHRFGDRVGYHSALLPPSVREWAGLDDADPVLGRKLTASILNDRGKSFNFIADRIEKY